MPFGQTNGHAANSPFRRLGMASKKRSYSEVVSLQTVVNNRSFNKIQCCVIQNFVCFSLRLLQEIQGESCNVRTSREMRC